MSSNKHRQPTVEDDPEDAVSHTSRSSRRSPRSTKTAASESTVRPPPHPAADDASVDSGYSSRTNKSSADSETLDQKPPPAAPSPPRSTTTTTAAAADPSVHPPLERRNTERKPTKPPHSITVLNPQQTQSRPPQHPQHQPLQRSNSSAARGMPVRCNCGKLNCPEFYSAGPTPTNSSRPPPAMLNQRGPAQPGYVGTPQPLYYNSSIPAMPPPQPYPTQGWSQAQQPIPRQPGPPAQRTRPSSHYGGMPLGGDAHMLYGQQQYAPPTPNPYPPPIQTTGFNNANRGATYNYTPSTPSPYSGHPDANRPPLPHLTSEPVMPTYAPQYAGQAGGSEPAQQDYPPVRPASDRRSTSPAVIVHESRRRLPVSRRLSRSTRPASYYEHYGHPEDEYATEYDLFDHIMDNDEDYVDEREDERRFLVVRDSRRLPRDTILYHPPTFAAPRDLAQRYASSRSVPRVMTIEDRDRQREYRRQPAATREREEGQIAAAQRYMSQHDDGAGGRAHDVSEIARPDARSDRRQSQASGVSEGRVPRTTSHNRRPSAHSRAGSQLSADSKYQTLTIIAGEQRIRIDGTDDVNIKDGQIIITTDQGREKRYIASTQSRMSASSTGSKNTRASRRDSRITSKTASVVNTRLDEEP